MEGIETQRALLDFIFCQNEPNFCGRRPPEMAARFLGNTAAAPKQAHRIRAVDAEFIGLLTLIDRFPPTAPDRLVRCEGFHTLLTRDRL